MSGSGSAMVKTSFVAKDSNVGGGKVGKSTRGWSNLPNNIIHKILDHVIKEAETSSLEQTWGHKPGAAGIAVAIARRRDLCEMRFVSRGWSSGIDSHAFWPKYTLLLDQSKSHISTVTDMRSSRMTPSTPTFPSLFHRARGLTLDTCIPCRLNHPDRMGFYPADPRMITWSNTIGLVPTCIRHKNKFCGSCLRLDGMHVTNHNGYRVVVAHCVSDIDKDGHLYRHPLVCNDCREVSLSAHAEKELERCARGGPITGSVYDIIETPYGHDFFNTAAYNARETAKLAVRDAWINNQTEYESFKETIMELQQEENALKLQFLLFGKRESLKACQTRIRLIEKLFDEPVANVRGYVQRAFQDVADRYDDWEEDEEEGENDDVEEVVENLGDVRAFWIELAQDAALYRWARDRIRAGYWVFPSDEVDALVRPELDTLTPRDTIVSTAKLPMGFLPYPRNPYNVQDLKFDILKSDDDSTFLPPQSILRRLDELYKMFLYSAIRKPFFNRIMYLVSSGYDSDELYARRLPVQGLLDHLRTEDAYIDLLPYRQQISFPISAPVWTTPKEGSPRIQAVPVPEAERDGHGSGFILDVEVEMEGDSEMTVDDIETDDNDNISADSSGSEVYSSEEAGKSRTTSSEEPIVEDQDEDEDRSIMEKTTPPVDDHPGSAFHTPIHQIVGQEYQYTHEQEQESNEVNGNGKRKTPPTATMSINDINDDTNDETNRPTKRRSSNSSIPISNSNETNRPRKPSEDSLTSSDPMPSTPLIGPAPPILNGIELNEIKRRTRAVAEPRVTKAYVAHIPNDQMKLGPETEKLLEEIYDNVLEPWVCCRCNICMRMVGFRPYDMD